MREYLEAFLPDVFLPPVQRAAEAVAQVVSDVVTPPADAAPAKPEGGKRKAWLAAGGQKWMANIRGKLQSFATEAEALAAHESASVSKAKAASPDAPTEGAEKGQ